MNHQNELKQAIEQGESVVGARAMTLSPLVVEVYGEIGLDFVWLDFEHTGYGPYDSPVFEHLTRAAEAADIDLLVRLPSGEPSLIRKVLDAGVRTCLIPRVETADEVRRAVRASQFEYDGDVGDRGVAAGRASEWGGANEDYPAREDEQVLIGTMIENETALRNVDEILSVPELGFAFIGPGDLSVSLGHPFQTDHPDVQSAIGEVQNACLSAGVPVGRITNSTERAETALDSGYQILRIGGEVAAARTILGQRLDSLGKKD